MFTSGCIFHRGDYADPLIGVAAVKAVVVRVHELYQGFKTTVYDLIGEDDMIAEECIARDELGILLDLGIVPEINTNKL